MDEQVQTVLSFLNAAQTILAIYGSPDGPIDPEACYNMLVQLLENPTLLKAQLALAPAAHGIVMILKDQILPISAMVDASGGSLEDKYP